MSEADAIQPTPFDGRIGRLASWSERPRYCGEQARRCRGRIIAIRGTLALLELIGPQAGEAYAPLKDLHIEFEEERPPAVPLPPAPGVPGASAPGVWKPTPIDPDKLRKRLRRPRDRAPEPRFHMPSGPIAAPARPPCDRADGDVAQAREWLSRRPPSISGQRGRPHTYATACTVLYGWELDEPTTLMLLDEWNTCNRPPWRPDELAAIVAHAAKYGSKYKPGFMRRGRRPGQKRGPRRNRRRAAFDGWSPGEFFGGESGDVEPGADAPGTPEHEEGEDRPHSLLSSRYKIKTY